MSKLIDDCLWHILSHLTIEQKVGVARVCKKWQRLVREIIENGEEKIEINDHNEFFNPASLAAQDMRFFRGYQFESVKSVTFSSIEIHLKLSTLKWLFAHLPNLEALSVTSLFFEVDLNDSEVGFLSKLKKLWLKVAFYNPNLFPASVLSNSSNLINFAWLMRFGDKCIDYFPKSLEKVTFKKLSLEMFKKVTNRLDNLNELKATIELVNNQQDSTGDVITIFENCPKIVDLDLSFEIWNLFLKFINLIPKFKLPKLNKLCLASFAVAVGDFANFVELAPNLTEIDFAYFRVECPCPQPHFQESTNSNLSDESDSDKSDQIETNDQFESYWKEISSCENCLFRLVINLANVKQLRALKIRPYQPNNAVDRALTNLLGNRELTNLQNLQLYYTKHSISLFQEFCQKAEENPKKLYRMSLKQFDVYEESEDKQIRQQFKALPLNLFFDLIQNNK